MFRLSLIRITEFVAAGMLIFSLSSCGGGSNSTHTLTQTAPSGPRHVQALMFTTASPLPSSFFSNVLPNITGVAVPMNWSGIDQGNKVYDFSTFDSNLAKYYSAGAKVNLIVWPATEGGTNNSTPSYVFGQTWANDPSVNAPLQDLTVCGDYNGDSSNPFYSSAVNGGGGIWNTSVSGDLSGLPVSYEKPFMVAYQNFIQAVIAHYNAPGAPAIDYIRFGMSQGGESSPECNQYWPSPAGGGQGSFNETEYISYVTTMTQFITAQNPSMTILEDLHAVGDPADLSYADQEAALAVANKEGFGTNGLQQSDTTASACDSDWCAVFAQYGGTTYGGNPITLSLQTLQYTDPTGAAETGSFTVLEPFAKSHGANNLEVYLGDLGLAFDPGNYCGYLPPNAGCPSFSPSTYSAAYAAAIQDFLSQ